MEINQQAQIEHNQHVRTIEGLQIFSTRWLRDYYDLDKLDCDIWLDRERDKKPWWEIANARLRIRDREKGKMAVRTRWKRIERWLKKPVEQCSTGFCPKCGASISYVFTTDPLSLPLPLPAKKGRLRPNGYARGVRK